MPKGIRVDSRLMSKGIRVDSRLMPEGIFVDSRLIRQPLCSHGVLSGLHSKAQATNSAQAGSGSQGAITTGYCSAKEARQESAADCDKAATNTHLLLIVQAAS
jgi:hypothetical protein